MIQKKCWVVSLLFVFCIAFFPKEILTYQAFSHTFLPKTHVTLQSEMNEAKVNHFSLSFSTDELKMIQEDNGFYFQLENCGMIDEPGLPKLPMFEKRIDLQKNQTVLSVETVSLVAKEMVLLKAPIALHLRSLPYRKDYIPYREDELNADSYSISLAPKENFKVQPCYTSRDRFLRIYIYPLYIHQEKLYFTKSITIKYTTRVENKEEPINKRKKDSVILVHDEFLQEGSRLKTIQEKQGYSVVVLPLSEVSVSEPAERPKSSQYKGYSDFDPELIPLMKEYDDITARKIITWLQESVLNDRIDYLTILGDATLIPPSYYVYLGLKQTIEEWFPTDIFYASPFNMADEFVFSVKVGRIPVRDKGEAQVFIQKMERYIQNFSVNWYSKAALLGGDPFVYYPYNGELSATYTINHDCLNGFQIEKFFKTEDRFEGSTFIDLLQNKDVGVIYENGHGSGSDLYFEPGMVNVDDIYNLPEKENLPVFISISCVNGAWDTRMFPDYFTIPKKSVYPTSISQSFLFSQGGSIAYFGGARSNIGGSLYTNVNGFIQVDELTYMDYLFYAVCNHFHDNPESLGDIAMNALTDYLQSKWGLNPDGGINTFFGFALLGDPTLTLPALEKTESYAEPVLGSNEKWKMNRDNYPLCPIDSGFNIRIQTDSPGIHYIFGEYDVETKAYKQSGSLPNPSKNALEVLFKPSWKGNLVLRIETEDKKENRFVFWSKYNHDLVVIPQPALSHLRPGEKQKIGYTILNDGIEEEEGVEFEIQFMDQKKVFPIKAIPSFVTYFASIEVEYQPNEKTELIATAHFVENETNTADNECHFILYSPKKPFKRIGYWGESTLLTDERDPAALTGTLNISMQQAGFETEFFPLFSKYNLEDNTFMADRLKPDCILLDSPDAFFSQFALPYRSLSHYLQQGGKIISFGSIGSNSAFPIRTVHPLFSLTPENRFHAVKHNNQSAISIEAPFKHQFSSNEFDLPVEHIYYPDGNVRFSSLFQESSLVASDKGNGIFLMDNGSVSIVNATFDWSGLEKHPDLTQFLNDLLTYMVQKPTKPVIQGVKIDPPVGIKNQTAHPKACIQYNGQTTTPDLQLMILGQPQWTQSIPVPSIQPYEYREIPFELDLHKMSGTKSLQLVLVEKEAAGKTTELSTITVPFTIESHNEPDEPPSLFIQSEDAEETTEEQWILKGKTLPGANLQINQTPYEMNEDGSFEILFPLAEGVNEFQVVVTIGSMQTTRKIIVHRLQPVSVSLPIGKRVSLLNGEERILDEPATIVNGSTFVPLRFVADSFRIQVEWDAKLQKISLKQNGMLIELWINKKTAKINGQDVTLSAAPFIRNGRTLVPVRFIAEGLKADVSWKKESREVLVRFGVPYDTPQAWFKLKNEPGEKPENEPIVLDDGIPDELDFPLCIDQYMDQIYAVTSRNIIIYDQDFTIIKKVPIPPFYFQSGSLEEKQTLLSRPNRFLLRVNKQFLVLTDFLNAVFVFDRETLQLIDCVKNIEYGLSLSNNTLFSSINDIEISSDNKLYFSDLYHVYVYDLNQHCFIYSFYCFRAMDIVITADKLFVSNYYNLISYSIEGEYIRLLGFYNKTKELFLYYSISLYDDKSLIAFNYMNQTLNLIQDNGLLLKTVKILNKNTVVDRIIKVGNHFCLLSLTPSNKIPYYPSAMVFFNDQFDYIRESHSESVSKITGYPKFLPTTQKLLLAKDGTRYFEVLSQSTAPKIIAISPDTDQLEEIDIPLQYLLSSYWDRIKDITITPDEKLGVLMFNWATTQHSVYIYDLKEGNGELFELLPSIYFTELQDCTFNDKVLIGYDSFFNYFVVFDLKTGLETARFSIFSDLLFCSVDDMKLRGDTVYFSDTMTRSVYSLGMDGKAKTIINTTFFLPYSGKGVVDFDVDPEGLLYLVDHISGTVSVFNGLEAKQWGSRKLVSEVEDRNSSFLSYWNPMHISVNDHRILIHDFGNKRVVEIPKNYQETKRKLNKTIMLAYPSIHIVEFYREEELLIPISVQVLNRNGQKIQVTNLPSYCKADLFSSGLSSQVMHIRIYTSGIHSEKTDSVDIVCGDVSQKILFVIKPLSPYLMGSHGSPYIHYPHGYFLSKSDFYISKGIVFAGLDFLEFYGFDVSVSEGRIQIAHDGKAMLLEPERNLAWIEIRGKQIPFLLDSSVKKDDYQWCLPLNSLLDYFGRSVTIQEIKIHFSP